MESENLTWDWKQEPLWKQEPCSPVFIPIETEEDTWMFEDELASVEDEKPFQQQSRGEVASELLHNLDEWKQEIAEPFSDWLEEKIDLPIFEDLPVEQPRDSFYGPRNSFSEVVKQPAVIEAAPLKELPSAAPVSGIPVSDTQALLREFESVYDEVELNNGTLTPPQSPTISQNLLYNADVDVATTSAPMYITSFQNVIPIQSFSAIPAVPIKITPISSYIPILIQEKKPTTLTNLEQMVPATPVPDIAKELADVEELVRTCAEDIGTTTDPWENVNVSNNTIGGSVENHFDRTPPSPSTSSNSSFESSEDGADDPDWIPISVHTSECGKVTNRKRSGTSKPYGRPGSEDKRQRKKEQNKNAATRYRQKKKAEVEVILSEEKGLEGKNVELKQKLSDLSREIKYLKGLMRDVFRAKGLIK